MTKARRTLWMALMAVVFLGFCLLAGAVLFVGSPAQSPGDRPLKPWAEGRGPDRIVAFGTSLSAGNPWPQVLATRVSACLGHPIDLQVVAGFGMGSAWGLEQLQRVISAAPDLVLIEFAINDADARDGVWLAKSRAQHLAMLDTLQDALPEARFLLMTMNPVAGWKQRLLRGRLDQYYAAYGTLADEAGTGLADLTPRWRAAPNALRLPPDGVHPTAMATERVIVPSLTAMIVDAVPGAKTSPACAVPSPGG